MEEEANAPSVSTEAIAPSVVEEAAEPTPAVVVVGGPLPIPPETAHGQGDRNAYYNKWDKFAKVEVAQVEAEEEEAKKNSALGLDGKPVNEQHAKDLDKRKALKAAKKLWDGVQETIDSKKLIIEKETNMMDRVIEDDDSHRVIVLKSNEDCCYIFPEHLSLVKIFMEGCKRCTIKLHSSVRTGTLEVTRCENLIIHVLTRPINTVQIDLSERISVLYGENLFADSTNSKIYHATSRQLRVEYDSLETVVDDFELCELAKTPGEDGAPAALDTKLQFVTAYLEGNLSTDLVVRDAAGHPTTMREINSRKRAIEATAVKNGQDLNSESLQKSLKEYDPLTANQLGRKHKDNGNICFKDADYLQATLHYSSAIEELEGADPKTDAEAREILIACLSNRAACALKIGDHEVALADSSACLAMDPVHVKATFRKGMALHALKRYREACPVLGKALEQQPGNAQIKAALTFAERRASMPEKR
jgi:tetratricopeptide (TPR) repeat protein